MPSAADEIRARIEAFATDLDALVRRTAAEAVRAALGGSSPAVAAPAPAAPPARTRAPSRAAVSKPAHPKRAHGQKRAPAEIERLVDKLAGYVEVHPGATMATIKNALAVPRDELVLPAKRLIEAGTIRAEGKKQGTRYFPV
jgi:hypothetical protein